ncbi:GlcNAc-PI de-N-acetylase [Rubrobacter radiotolerans]|uniref:GlcNAc-PI de-N-acetylase n=1 Tax=Rubrobacter radiotolerans TaxID=42256 RepID=A0A023X6I8_RUBRA|nr:PIG-L family deacetylase [Rubrobacter radiotolerans]AHY47679.1 GlcNAc-PI de-N-acetylase [Rubrobacter radiotolerans]MDX5895082.1 PIG-L family deacetylase [Rubrobacter radiotolerans]
MSGTGMGRTALFVSPHLDDVAFSCGGTLARLSQEGWRCVLLTVFTRSVPGPRGFALACQTDKGLPPEVDYMDLRRAEDREFARRIGPGVAALHLDHPEAPHRNYGSAPELFAGVRPDDGVWRDLSRDLGAVLKRKRPDLLLAPQGLGGHVDHEQTLRALFAVLEEREVGGDVLPDLLFYRDAPYAIRSPKAVPSALLPGGTAEVPVTLAPEDLEAKLRATESYTTQLGFQFGGAGEMRKTLRCFARSEAGRLGTSGLTEALLAAPPERVRSLFEPAEEMRRA